QDRPTRPALPHATATHELSTLSLHDALPIYAAVADHRLQRRRDLRAVERDAHELPHLALERHRSNHVAARDRRRRRCARGERGHRRRAQEVAAPHGSWTGRRPSACRLPASTAARASSDAGTSPYVRSAGTFGTSAASYGLRTAHNTPPPA